MSTYFPWLTNTPDEVHVPGAGTGILSFTLAALRQALRRKRLQETLAAEGVHTTEREEEDDEIFVTDLGKGLLRSI